MKYSSAQIADAYLAGDRLSGVRGSGRCGPRANGACSPLEEELQGFGHNRLPDLGTAIRQAASCVAMTENGRTIRHPHQRRIQRDAITQGKKALLARESDIAACNSFDELIALVGRVFASINGLGELTTYDVALRIAYWMRRMPEAIYLHAGTRTGARNLGLTVRGKKWISVDEVPAELRRNFSAAELEDILCIYKNQF